MPIPSIFHGAIDRPPIRPRTASRGALDCALCVILFLWCGATSMLALGCAGESSPPSDLDPQDTAQDLSPEAALRLHFPAQADRVLRGAEAFVAAGDRFAPAGARELPAALERRGGLSATLPKRGEDAIRMHHLAGVDLEVRELGAWGDGEIVDGAIAYSTEGGTSFWSAIDSGYEEWLLLGAGVATGEEPAAVWEVQGGELREADGAVEIEGPGGALVRVTAPEAFAIGGRPIAARLAVQGARIELWVDADGEPALVDPVWSVTGSMGSSRYSHTASVLSNGKVLVAGGFSNGVLASTELYDPQAGTWSPAGSLGTARYTHRATVLPSGKVLVTGGIGPGGTLSSAETYDPATNAWTPAAAVPGARYLHTATLLGNGKVLVAGGYNGGYLNTTYVYDPALNSWASAGTLFSSRYSHSATLLGNGKVLVVGGYGGSYLASSELYNPATNTWAPGPSMSTGRYSSAAVRLQNGKVLVTGGYNGSYVTNADLYDPVANSWSAAAPMGFVRGAHTATLLPSGKVLVAGSAILSAFASTEIYDPAANTWSPAGTLHTGRYNHTAALLSNGKVLLAGGFNGATLSSAELFDPTANTWASAGSMPAGGRYYHTITLLQNGKALVAGGYSGSSILGTTQLYDPATLVWTAAAPLTTPRYLHTATLLGNGKVLVTGGYGTAGYLTSSELYTPSTNSWAPAGSLANSRYLHTATMLGDGRVLVTGGYGGGVARAASELFNPTSSTFTAVGSLSAGRYGHSATLLGNGKVLVAGGYGSGYIQSAELYDPVTAAWSPAGNMAASRYGHTAAWLSPAGKLLVAGGYNTASGYLSSCELYNPATNSWAAAAPMSTPRYFHTMSSLPGGTWLVAGGYEGVAGYLASAEVYDPSSGAWIPATPMSVARSYHASTGTLLPSGAVLTTGGANSTGALASAELYTPVLIDDQNPCTADTWNASTGQVTHTPKPAGTPCPDTDLCDGIEVCNTAGACVAGTPVTCTALDECHMAGTCDPSTGLCSNPEQEPGSPCTLPNAAGACQAGVCLVASCDPEYGDCNGVAADGCEHDVTADEANCGACGNACAGDTTCSYPQSCNNGTCGGGGPKPNGTACDDGNPCTQTDACAWGECLGEDLVVCSASDQCHFAGACDADVGACSNVAKPDGTPCDDGNPATSNDGCVAGVCTGEGAPPPPACDTEGRDLLEEPPLHPGGLITTCPLSSPQSGWLDVTACHGPNDPDWSAAFNLAVRQVLAGHVRSKTIFVPSGQYNIAHPVHVHGYGIRIIGEDPATTTLTWTGAPYVVSGGWPGYPNTGYLTPAERDQQSWMFLLDAAHRAEIKRLTLDGASSGEVAIRQANFSNNGGGYCICGDDICDTSACSETAMSCPADCPQDPNVQVSAYSSSTQARFSDLVIKDFARGIWGGLFPGSQDDTTLILRVQFREIGQAWVAPIGKPITSLAAVVQSSQNAYMWNVQDSTFDHCVTGLWTHAGAATSTNAWNNAFRYSTMADVVASGSSFFDLRGNLSYQSKRFVLGNGIAQGQSADEDGYTGTGSAGGAPVFMTIEDNVILDPTCPAGDVLCAPIDLRQPGSFSIIDNSFRTTVAPAIRFHKAVGYTNNATYTGTPAILLGNRFSLPQVGPGFADQDENQWWQAWTLYNQAYYPPVPDIHEYRALDNVQADLSAIAAPSMSIPTPVFRNREVYDVIADVIAQNPAVGTVTPDAYCGQRVDIHGPALGAWINNNLAGHTRPFLYFPAACYYMQDGAVVVGGGLDVQIMGDGLATALLSQNSTDYLFRFLAPARATVRDLRVGGPSVPGAIQVNSFDDEGDQVHILGSSVAAKGALGAAPLPPGDTSVALYVDGVDQTLVRADHSSFGHANNVLRVIGGGAGASGSSHTRGLQLVGSFPNGSTNASYDVGSWGKIVSQGGEVEQTWGINLSGRSGYLTLTATRYVVDMGSEATWPQWQAIYPDSGKIVLDGFSGSVSLLSMQTGLAVDSPDATASVYWVASQYYDWVDGICSLLWAPPPAPPIAPMASGGAPASYQEMVDCSPAVSVSGQSNSAVMTSLVQGVYQYGGAGGWQCEDVVPGGDEAAALRAAYADLRASKVTTPKAACGLTNTDLVLDRLGIVPNDTTLATGTLRVQRVTQATNN